MIPRTSHGFWELVNNDLAYLVTLDTFSNIAPVPLHIRPRYKARLSFFGYLYPSISNLAGFVTT
jgi:hypothetical protein